MQWQENQTWAVDDQMALLSLTLRRNLDGYLVTIAFTSTLPWNSIHLAVSCGEAGYQLTLEAPTVNWDQHGLALELSEVLEHLKGPIMQRLSERGTRLSVPKLLSMIRNEIPGFID